MSARSDPYRYFRIEARELTAQLLQALPQLARRPDDGSLISRSFRLAHTLKGAALVVKQRQIAELAHALEDGLLPYREGAPVPPGQPDRLKGLLREIERRLSENMSDPRGRGRTSAGEALFISARVEIAELDALLGEVEETQVQLQGVHRILANVEHAGRLAELLAQRLAPASAGVAVPIDPGGSEELSALADELRSLLPRLHDGLGQAVDNVARELRQVHDKAEQVRLLPARTLLAVVEGAAADAASTLGKQVRFTTRGGDVRLSAEVLAALQPALVQLARNAIAHGIEPSSERRKLGKPEAGRVEIKVERKGHAIAFTCSDDGAGVDMSAVAYEARRSGQVDAKAGAADNQALLRLLLHGRISTCGQVTKVAGRGVGLDVVRDVVERLSAHIHLDTARGRGSSFELVVPVSLSALDVLIVDARGASLAIPLDAVERSVEARAGDIAQTADGEAAWLEHSSIPLLRLSAALGGASVSACAAPHSLVVVRAGSARAAIGVDRVHGVAKLVVRPLPPLSPASPLVGGVAIDAHGNPQLVLDPERLVDCAKPAARERGTP